MNEEITSTSKLNVMLWSTYDIANTIFSMGIVSMTIIQYGTIMGMMNGFDYGLSYFLTFVAVAISNLIVAITIPVMGTFSDNSGKGKPGTILFGSLTILLTGMVFLFNNFFIALTLFIGANIFYQYGNLFYDTMIPRICRNKDIGRVSAVGVALGYFGSFFAVIFSLAASLAIFGEPANLPDNIAEINPSQYEAIIGPKAEWLGHLDEMWWICAIGFFLIALPFLFSRERAGKSKIAEVGLTKLIKSAISETAQTAREIWRNPDPSMKWFILAWFFTVDVVQTVINIMKPAAVDGFGMSEGAATILLLIGVVFAVLLTGIAGPIADKKGPVYLSKIVCGTWLIALAIPIFAGSFDPDVKLPIFLSFLPNFSIYLMALLVGFGMGSIWVVQRTMTVELAPPEKIGRYFGFSKLAGKGSAAIGMILFGGVVSMFSSFLGSSALAYKVGLILLFILFLIGSSFFMRVRDHHKEYLSGKRAPYE